MGGLHDSKDEVALMRSGDGPYGGITDGSWHAVGTQIGRLFKEAKFREHHPSHSKGMMWPSV